MEEKNLNIAPTEQELIDAGFEDSHFGLMEFNLGDNTTIVADTLNDTFRFIGSSTWIELTKQKINDAFALFNQPLPQWEKPKPKVGEVWKNGKTVYLINDTVLKATIRVTIVSDNDLETGTIVNIVSYGLTKLANSLEEYYKQKFTK